jgi:hypothetical protein
MDLLANSVLIMALGAPDNEIFQDELKQIYKMNPWSAADVLYPQLSAQLTAQ